MHMHIPHRLSLTLSTACERFATRVLKDLPERAAAVDAVNVQALRAYCDGVDLTLDLDGQALADVRTAASHNRPYGKPHKFVNEDTVIALLAEPEAVTPSL